MELENEVSTSVASSVGTETNRLPDIVIRAQHFKQVYDLKEQLGRGAFSVVHRCVKIGTGMEFAAKMINTKRMKVGDLDKVENEARICRVLKHPNIVQIHDAIRDEGFYILIFDLVTGGELFDDIVARISYSELDASFCAQQVLDAIAFCHRQGVVHRDLKPENLLLSSKLRGAQIKVADFGLAQVVKGDEFAWHGFCGTPGYISPEVVKRIPYGKPVDIWSIGVILYILLVGYPPFYDEDDKRLYEKIKSGRFYFHSPEWDSVTTEAKTLITNMLQLTASQRITAADALKNPWIYLRKDVASPLNRLDTIERMKTFNARRKLKAAVMTTMVATSTFTSHHLKKKADAATEKEHQNVDIPAQPIVKPDKSDSANSSARRQEIVRLTERLLWAIDNVKYDIYMKLIVPYVTTFDPDTFGDLVQGAEFHKTQFERISKRQKVISTKIINPYVHLLGPDAACIAYTRLTHYFDRDRIKQFQHSEETRIWQKQNDVWQNVHIHRSIYSPQQLSKSSNSIIASSERFKKQMIEETKRERL